MSTPTGMMEYKIQFTGMMEHIHWNDDFHWNDATGMTELQGHCTL